MWLAGCSSYSHNDAGLSIDDDIYSVCNETIRQQIDQIASREVNKKESPGVAVAFQLHGGEIVFINYGYTQNNGSQKISEHSLFAIGSITKGFTAEYMAMLVQNGFFMWNTKLSELDMDARIQLRSATPAKSGNLS